MTSRRGGRKRGASLESRWKRAIPVGLLSAVVGLGAGTIVAGFVAALGGVSVNWVIWFFPLVSGLSGYLVGALVIETAGHSARRLFMGSEVGTRAQYSVAEGLVARGEYRAALDAYRQGIEDEPGDPTPHIRGGILLRDHLDRPREALEWLTGAREVGPLEESEEITIARELARLYEDHLDQPGRAIPELVRIFESFPGTRAADAAARRVRELRARLLQDTRG